MRTEVRHHVNDVSCRQLAVLFARVGLTSFGGGLSAWLYREVVTQRDWLDDREFLSAMTLGQILPGTNVVNLAVYVGYRMRGAPGSVVAVVALLAPPMIVIVLLASFLQPLLQMGVVHQFLEGIAAGAVGMSASVGFRAARVSASTQRWPLVMSVAVFVAIGLLRWPLVPVAIAAAMAGLLIAGRTRDDA